jgi:AcrR family transcriptional regulator
LARRPTNPPSPRATSPEWAEAREAQLQLKREAILRAASRLLNEHGYAGTSMADVAASLSITNNALYYYFESKEELAFECFVRGQRILAECFERAGKEGANGLERVVLFVSNVLAAARERGALPAVAQFFALSDEHQRVLRQGHRRLLASLSGFLEAGIDDGSVRRCDPAIASAMMMSALYAIPADPDVRKSDPATIGREMIAFIRHSLAPR